MGPILVMLAISRDVEAVSYEELGWHVDVDINTSDTFTPTHNQISGLITRACARQLNN
jgi:hypothetical protein